jgi:hypothetical protein
MANEAHLSSLKQDVKAWNDLLSQQAVRVDLSEADLREADESRKCGLQRASRSTYRLEQIVRAPKEYRSGTSDLTVHEKKSLCKKN